MICRPRRRGLTMLELMLAMTVTVFVAAAISSMLGAVTRGVVTRKDNRNVMIRGSVARTRLGAYIAPARSIIDSTGDSMVIWFNDRRKSGTVHESEVRWLTYDADAGTIAMEYASYPKSWTQVAVDLEDLSRAKASDWWQVRDLLAGAGHLGSLTLVDGLTGVRIGLDDANHERARHITFDLDLETDHGGETARIAATIRNLEPPDS